MAKRGITALVALILLALCLAAAQTASADEGYVDEPKLGIWVERPVYNMQYEPNVSQEFSMTQLSYQYNRFPAGYRTWSCEQIAGRPVTRCYLREDPSDIKFVTLHIGGRFAPDKYVFRVTCELDGLAAFADVTLNVVQKLANMPDGIVYDVGNMVVIKPGERFTLGAPRNKPANSTMPEGAVYKVYADYSARSYPLEIDLDEQSGKHVFSAKGPGIYVIEPRAIVQGAFYIKAARFLLLVSDTPDDLSYLFPNLALRGEVIMINEYSKPGSTLENFVLSEDSLLPPDAEFKYTAELVEGVDCISFELIPKVYPRRVGIELIEILAPGGAGRYRLSATCERYNLSCSAIMQVQPDGDYIETLVAPTQTTLNLSKASIREKGDVKLRVAKFKPAKTSKALRRVIWESDDSAVASVDENGLVVGVGAGETTIRAYALTVKGVKNADVVSTCRVIVRPPKIERLSFGETQITVKAGDTRDLGAILSVEPLGSEDRIVWKSGKPRIAKVRDGVITALKPGATKITASVKGSKNIKAVVTVEVD